VTGREGTLAVGALSGSYPYVRIGVGAPLVVLPGLVLDNGAPGPVAARAYRLGFRRLARSRAVYVVPRGRDLPPDAAMPELAAGYADLIRREWGRADVMGLSTGGAIAQHLALDHPDVVDRLALVVTGARLSATGREICARWLQLARDDRWQVVRAELAESAVDGATARRLARASTAMTGRRPPAAVDARDFMTTVAAVLDHDVLARLAGLSAPVLLVGGSRDPFFPETSLRETAGAIPGATLKIYDGYGHGVPKHRAGMLQQQVTEFLTGSPAS
jgi:pimeloyl-ACP methyl ester carboxylesterase